MEGHSKQKGGHALTPTVSASLQSIPWIGPNLARDLIDLGYTDPDDLRGEDPEKMYANLCKLRGERIDPCVLYTFRCAVYFVSNDAHDPHLLKWWHWKDRTI
jgi:hypothetical protein